MSQWQDVNGVSTEAGLSPGQTAGNVGGTYVERPSGSDVGTVYIGPRQDTPEQSRAKQTMLQSPTAQWASEEDYMRAYRGCVAAGGNPDIRPAGVFLSSTQAERNAESARYQAMQEQGRRVSPSPWQVSAPPMLTAALARYTEEQEYLASRRAPDQYAGIRRAAPITAGFYKRTVGLSAGLQTGFAGMIGYSETAHPIIKFVSGAGSLFTGLPQMVGMTAVVGEYGLRQPAKLPTALIKGLPVFGGQLVEQAKTYPWETAGMVGAMIAGPKVVKSVGERLPAGKLRTVEQPSAKGFLDRVAAKTPITQWKPSTTNPVWTPGKGWSVLTESQKTPITQWKPSTTNPVWTPGKGWSSGVVVGADMTYRGFSVEHGRKAQPIIGITNQPVTNIASLKLPGGKTLVAGTPRFQPEAIQDMFGGRFGSEAGYREFMSPTEYTIATKNILPTYDAPTQELFQATIAKRQLTYGMRSTHSLSDVPLEDVFARHGLKSETAQNLRSYMQKQKDLVIWGSTANKAQVMGKGGMGYFRAVHDIDIHVKNPLQTTQEMFNIISKTERPGFVTMKGGGLTTARGHLFDIKTIEGGLPEEWALSSSELPGKGNVFLFPSEKPVKLGKFSVQALSDQATSKLSSIGLRGKTISAAAHRAGKDPFDLVYVNEPSLTLDMSKSWNPYKRLAGGKAKALDMKIQGLTESKIRAQPIGALPGQITAQQKNLFFENLAAMRAGKAVGTLSGKELFYQQKPHSNVYQPVASGLLTGMFSGGTRISAGSIFGSTSLSFTSLPKPTPRSPAISLPRSPVISLPRSPAISLPRSDSSRSGYRIGGSDYSTGGPPPSPIGQPPSYPGDSVPRKFNLEIPKSKLTVSLPKSKLTVSLPKSLKAKSHGKLTVSLPKSRKAKSYGKFPEIARVASAGRVLGLKFPWEEKDKPKKSGKKAAASSKGRKASKSGAGRKGSSRTSPKRGKK